MKVMEKEKNRIKEPYSPEDTPNPPQIIDPSRHEEQNKNDRHIENKKPQPSGNRKGKKLTVDNKQ
jgi:hypothetical protein